MVYYKAIHLFFTRQADHIHYFLIGIYDSRAKASEAIALLKGQEGFCLRPDHFHVLPVLRLRKPKLLNRTYWIGGFETYTYNK